MTRLVRVCASASGVVLGLESPLSQVLELARDTVERRAHVRRAGANGTGPLGEVACGVELPRHQLVPPLQRNGMRQERGGVVGCHVLILAGARSRRRVIRRLAS